MCVSCAPFASRMQLRDIPVSVPGLARHAVLLTAPEAEARLPRLAQFWCNVSPLAATLIVPPVSVANKRLTAWLNPLDATLTKNRGVGAPPFDIPAPCPAHAPAIPILLPRIPILTDHCLWITDHLATSGSLPSFQPANPPTLKRMVNHLPCYTVPPWLANDSANTSSPIFIGARRSRAPFAFRPIPPSRSRGTINIAGLKLALVTAKCPSTSSPQALPSTPSKSIRLSSPACATSQNYSPVSPSSPATFSKPTSPPSLPAAASASTAIFPTTSPRRPFITCSTSPTSSTKSTWSSRTKSLFASPPSRARAITAIFPSSPSSTRAPNSSSKSPATLSIRRRKSLPRWSRSACPANAQSSPSAAHLTSWIL